MKNFCIITNRNKDSDLAVTSAVMDYLDNRGCRVGLIGSCDEMMPEDFDFTSVSSSDISDDTECCIVLGGDGTIIQAARELKREIPIVGINLGNLGFLSSVEKNEIYRAIDRLIADDFTVESRMMIEAETVRSDGTVEVSSRALNDVVVNRMGFSRMITVKAYVNGALVNSYFGDGLIVSTPTGSTGYNLSAGGPIVTPEAELMVITPICPHSLNMRSIVVSASDDILLKVEMNRATQPETAVITFDGQESVELGHGDSVRIRKSASSAKLVRFKDRSFFKLLYMKLGE